MPKTLRVGMVGHGFMGKVHGHAYRSLGFYSEDRNEGGASWFYYRDLKMTPIMGTDSLFNEAYRPRLIQMFPIRDNKEWHWADIGAEVGVIFFDVSAHVSPKETLDFAITTVAIPYNVILRPILSVCGMRLPTIDFCEDDTDARVRRKYEVDLIQQPPGLAPIEWFNERMYWETP